MYQYIEYYQLSQYIVQYSLDIPYIDNRAHQDMCTKH